MLMLVILRVIEWGVTSNCTFAKINSWNILWYGFWNKYKICVHKKSLFTV